MNIIEKLHLRGVKFVERLIDEEKLKKDLDERLDVTAREITMRQTRGNLLIQWGQYDGSLRQKDSSRT